MRKLGLALVVLAVTVGIVLGSLYGGLDGDDVLWPLTWLAWAPIGALILVQRPGNGVGRSMLAVGVLWGASFASLALANSDAPLEMRIWADLANVILGIFPWLAIVWTLLVFPRGGLETRLQRVTAGGLLLIGAFATYAFSTSMVPLDTTGELSPLATPALGELTEWFVAESGFLVVVVILAAAIVSVAQRWRASVGLERHQYRWLLLGAMVFGLIVAMSQFVPDDSPALISFFLAATAIPLSVGVAVTRYRLFEIDRILSRTVSYSVLVAMLAALFVLVVVGLPNWIPGLDDSPLLVAAATLTVAALFNPMRKRVQLAVDRRFNRSRYDAERVMDEFAGTLQGELDARGIVDGWQQVVTDTMEPASISVWTRS